MVPSENKSNTTSGLSYWVSCAFEVALVLRLGAGIKSFIEPKKHSFTGAVEESRGVQAKPRSVVFLSQSATTQRLYRKQYTPIRDRRPGGPEQPVIAGIVFGRLRLL